MKRIIIILIIFSAFAIIFLPGPFFDKAEIKSPEKIEEIKELGEKTLKATEEEFPGTIKKIWNWTKINIWSRVESLIVPEIEKRKEHLKGK